MIIARYDEIICDKAPKHALNEMRLELKQKLDEINSIASKSSNFNNETQELLTTTRENNERIE